MQQVSLKKQSPKPKPELYRAYVDNAPQEGAIEAWTAHSARLQAKQRYGASAVVVKIS